MVGTRGVQGKLTEVALHGREKNRKLNSFLPWGLLGVERFLVGFSFE